MKSLREALESLRSTTSTLGLGEPAPVFTIPDFKCPMCHGIGWVYRDIGDKTSREFGRVYPCSCRKDELEQRRWKSLVQYSGLPADAGKMTFDTFKPILGQEEAYQGCIDLLAGEVFFLTLLGPVNAGKTHLAVATCWEYVKLGIPARYVFTPLFLDLLRATYDRDASYSYLELFNEYARVPFLVMDDVFRQRQTEWASEKLMEVINARYMSKLTTIFTSNLSFEEICVLDKVQGEAIVSRLQREQWCRVVVMG